MSQSLGEKLRAAREDRGITISQVSEQTRIATHYLNAIEENDFSILPGGIFNKGFVRSFAKCVGVDEHEALSDYNELMASGESGGEEPGLYSPEVLTDGRGPSMASTVMLIVLILAVLIGGLVLAIYWLASGEEPAPVNTAPTPVVKQQAEPTPTPISETFKVEISASEKILEFSYEADGEKVPVKVMKPGESLTLELEDSFKASFYRSIVPAVSLKLNGVDIELSKPTKQYLAVTFDRNNIAEVVSAKAWGEAGAIEPVSEVAETETALPANKPQQIPKPVANVANATAAPQTTTRTTPKATPQATPRTAPQPTPRKRETPAR